MEGVNHQTGIKPSIEFRTENKTSSIKTARVVACLFVGVGGVAIAGIGVAGYVQIGTLSNLGQVQSILLMSLGAGWGIAFTSSGIIQAIKQDKKNGGNLKPPPKPITPAKRIHVDPPIEEPKKVVPDTLPILPPVKKAIKEPALVRHQTTAPVQTNNPEKPLHFKADPTTQLSGTEAKPQAASGFILAGTYINQFNNKGVKGPSACTPIACRFLALTLDSPASAEDIRIAIEGNTYADAEHRFTDDVIREFKELGPLDNPWFETQFTPEMQVDLFDVATYTFKRALTYLFNNPQVHGAIVTGQGVTVAMRKQGGKIEIFDSHGSAELTHSEDNRAYIYRSDLQEAIAFLEKRYPRMEGTEGNPQAATVSLFPLQIVR